MTSPLRSGVGALVALAACGSATRPPDAEIHRMVLAAVGEAVEAPSPMLVHPLLIQRGPERVRRLDQASLNAFDSISIPQAVETGDGDYRICDTNPAGMCDLPPSSVAVMLSELQDLGGNGIGAGAVVVDGRKGRPAQQYFMVRVNARSGGWEVVEVRGPT